MTIAHRHFQMNTVRICRTCPRDLPGSRVAGPVLMTALRPALHELGFETLLVHCLGDCRAPCAAVLDADGKPRLRYSGLEAQDAAELLAAARLYRQAEPARLAAGGLPAALRSRLSAVSPKPLR
jgi:predicted metal-binding protein